MQSKTVFVIGAGASTDAHLPAGKELLMQISAALNFNFSGRNSTGDPQIAQALELHALQENGNQDINPYIKEAWHIRDSAPLAMSIDNLLNSQPENKELSICGKLAIVRTILNAERVSLLSDKQFTNIDRARNTFNFHPLTNTWYIPFFQIITGNQKVEALEEHFQNLTLIIFNYDRCVERFLFLALKRFYNHLPDEKISSLIGTIKIYHPYGKVGDLPWQNPEQSTAYGADIHARELLNLASRIKTFTEGTDPNSSQIVEIRQQMAEAENLVFLGFAFLDINMNLIKPSLVEPLCSIQCYATALGLSESSIEAVIGDIRSLYTGNAAINVKKINCFDFFHEYNRKLGR